MLVIPQQLLPYVHHFGDAFVFISCVGLISGTFELAFERQKYMPDQCTPIPTRMVIHLLGVCVGAYIQMLQLHVTPGDPPLTVNRYIVMLLSMCLLTVGTIGLVVGSMEMGVISVSLAFWTRIAMYATCLIVGLYLCPYKHASLVYADGKRAS